MHLILSTPRQNPWHSPQRPPPDGHSPIRRDDNLPPNKPFSPPLQSRSDSCHRVDLSAEKVEVTLFPQSSPYFLTSPHLSLSTVFSPPPSLVRREPLRLSPIRSSEIPRSAHLILFCTASSSVHLTTCPPKAEQGPSPLFPATLLEMYCSPPPLIFFFFYLLTSHPFFASPPSVTNSPHAPRLK